MLNRWLRCQRGFQTQVVFECGTAFPKAMQKSSLGFLWRGLDVDGNHVFGQPRQQSGFDQRRLATSRWPVDHADRERVISIRFLDASLPKPQAIGQPVTISWTGQQFQEEVGIVSVKRPQPLGHDFDGLSVGRT
jgi:hypothetical protein